MGEEGRSLQNAPPPPSPPTSTHHTRTRSSQKSQDWERPETDRRTVGQDSQTGPEECPRRCGTRREGRGTTPRPTSRARWQEGCGEEERGVHPAPPRPPQSPRGPAGSTPRTRPGDCGSRALPAPPPAPHPGAPAKPGAASSAAAALPPAQAPRRPAPSSHWLAKNASLICAHLCTPPPRPRRLLGSDLPPSRSPGAVRRDAAAAAAAQLPLPPGSRPGLRPAPDAPLCPVAPPMVPGAPAPR